MHICTVSLIISLEKWPIANCNIVHWTSKSGCDYFIHVQCTTMIIKATIHEATCCLQHKQYVTCCFE